MPETWKNFMQGLKWQIERSQQSVHVWTIPRNPRSFDVKDEDSGRVIIRHPKSKRGRLGRKDWLQETCKSDYVTPRIGLLGCHTKCTEWKAQTAEINFLRVLEAGSSRTGVSWALSLWLAGDCLSPCPHVAFSLCTSGVPPLLTRTPVLLA